MNTHGGEQTGGGTRYEAPRLTAHGSVAEVTQALIAGVVLDKSLPAGSPVFGNDSL
ncbi:MAG TPA: lasso RiPP family leader peptide-containing protein [Acidimicrobiales bacterium]|nr:lasso RiPP family leader peptide-containing protein [Acidimicrobiales bacterium]